MKPDTRSTNAHWQPRRLRKRMRRARESQVGPCSRVPNMPSQDSVRTHRRGLGICALTPLMLCEAYGCCTRGVVYLGYGQHVDALVLCVVCGCCTRGVVYLHYQ